MGGHQFERIARSWDKGKATNWYVSRYALPAGEYTWSVELPDGHTLELRAALASDELSLISRAR